LEAIQPLHNVVSKKGVRLLPAGLKEEVLRLRRITMAVLEEDPGIGMVMDGFLEQSFSSVAQTQFPKGCMEELLPEINKYVFDFDIQQATVDALNVVKHPANSAIVFGPALAYLQVHEYLTRYVPTMDIFAHGDGVSRPELCAAFRGLRRSLLLLMNGKSSNDHVFTQAICRIATVMIAHLGHSALLAIGELGESVEHAGLAAKSIEERTRFSTLLFFVSTNSTIVLELTHRLIQGVNANLANYQAPLHKFDHLQDDLYQAIRRTLNIAALIPMNRRTDIEMILALLHAIAELYNIDVSAIKADTLTQSI
jgi:hypothetical protein